MLRYLTFFRLFYFPWLAVAAGILFTNSLHHQQRFLLLHQILPPKVLIPEITIKLIQFQQHFTLWTEILPLQFMLSDLGVIRLLERRYILQPLAQITQILAI